MSYIIAVALVIAGIIHILPLPGVLGEVRLNALYGIQIDDPNLLILMRHRAVLFALLGAFLIFAAFKPNLQTLAIIAGLVSTIAFLWLAWSTGGYNAQLSRVVVADVIAIAALSVAGGVRIFQ